MEATWGQLVQDAKKAAEPITEGQHRVKIVDAQATKSSTDKLMFVIKVEIVEGPDVKRRTTTNLTVSPENGTALAIFFRNMEAIGLDANFFAGEPNPDQVAAAMLNREVGVIIKHQVWQGVKSGKVDRWIPLGGGLQGIPGGGPIAPGTVIGPAGPPLPTSATPAQTATPATTPASPLPGVAVTTSLESVKSTTGPIAPTNEPPALPI